LELGEEGDLLESDDVVARLDVGHALADRLDDTGALVAQDNGEGTLGVLARECEGICGPSDIAMKKRAS
jgi:hypothetical protein